MMQSLACGLVGALRHEELQRMDRNSVSDTRSNRDPEIPEQSRPRSTDLVPVLGVLWIGPQPQGLVVTPSGALGFVSYPVTEPRVVEERRLSVVGEALVQTAPGRRGEFVVETGDSMNDGMGELVHADVAGPRRGMGAPV
jgi:hypothetical protein